MTDAVKPTWEQIDRLVRDAHAQLRGAATTGGPATATETKPNTDAHVLRLSGRVITLEQVEQRLTGKTQLVAPARAIITPAVVDLLREKKVLLLRTAEAATDETSETAKPSGVLATLNTKFCPAALLQQLKRQKQPVERIVGSGLEATTAELADHAARGGRRAALVTEQPFAATMFANRRHGVRAAAVRSRDELRQAQGEMQLNYVIIDPRGLGSYVVSNLIYEFMAGGRP